MKKALAFLIVLILLITIPVGCKKENYSYWDIKAMIAEDDSLLESYAVIKLSASTFNDLWINISNVEAEKVDFYYITNTSLTSVTGANNGAVTVTKAQAKNGWIRLITNNNYISTYFEIYTTNTMHINEIVFINKDGEKIKAELIKAGVRVQDTTSKNEYTKEELEKACGLNSASTSEKIEITMKNTALGLLDEQDKFDLEKAISNLGSEASSEN